MLTERWFYLENGTPTGPFPLHRLLDMVAGLGMGSPIISLMCMWVGYSNLQKDGTASWDAGRYVVTSRPRSVQDAVLVILGVMVVIALVITLRILAQR